MPLLLLLPQPCPCCCYCRNHAPAAATTATMPLLPLLPAHRFEHRDELVGSDERLAPVLEQVPEGGADGIVVHPASRGEGQGAEW